MTATEKETCAYCNAEDCDQIVPPTSDTEAWDTLAVQHADDCEWILTRAHRLPSPTDHSRSAEEHFDADHIHTTPGGRHFRHGDGREVDGEGVEIE